MTQFGYKSQDELGLIGKNLDGVVLKLKGLFISSNQDAGDLIASAVEEQSATTIEVAINVAQASQEIQEVSENMVTNSAAVEDVSQKIQIVNTSATDIATESSEVGVNARELSKMAETLRAEVIKFKIA